MQGFLALKHTALFKKKSALILIIHGRCFGNTKCEDTLVHGIFFILWKTKPRDKTIFYVNISLLYHFTKFVLLLDS